MKKRITAVLIPFMLAFLFLITGCGKKEIDGTWVLVEEHNPDGTVLSGKELKKIVEETYVIKEGKVDYTCVLKDMDMDPINITFELEYLGNDRYNFNLKDSFTFIENAKMEGNTLSYTVGTGADATEMVFKRK